MPVGDYFGLPDNIDKQQFFDYVGGTSTVTAPEYQTWPKPRGISMVHILSIDPGSGGGGGFSGATSTQRGGGGSGTSGCIASLLIPAVFIPDLMYIFVASGSSGGAAGVSGGNPSYNAIMAYPGVSNNNYACIFSSNSTGPGGGGHGTASAGGSADAAESANPIISSVLTAGIGMLASIGTSGGNIGGASGVGTVCSPSKIVSCVMPGGGGAGCTSGNVDSAGGGISSSTSIPWLLAGIPGGAAGGGRGNDGFATRSPLFFTGGTGGGSFSAGTGGAGGNGAIGCGGGGGGGGITGGAGGNGGNGLVVVTCW
jgi:hypothetical protein